MGLAFLGEPPLVFVVGRADARGGDVLLQAHPWSWAGEIALGAAAIAVIVARGQRHDGDRVSDTR